jgi:hypothetical protein
MEIESGVSPAKQEKKQSQFDCSQWSVSKTVAWSVGANSKRAGVPSQFIRAAGKKGRKESPHRLRELGSVSNVF